MARSWIHDATLGMWECRDVGTPVPPPHQTEKRLWIGIVSVSEKWETEKQGKKFAFFVFCFFFVEVVVLCKVPYNLYFTTIQYVFEYCVVCSPCVLLVEYVCKYCVKYVCKYCRYVCGLTCYNYTYVAYTLHNTKLIF